MAPPGSADSLRPGPKGLTVGHQLRELLGLSAISSDISDKDYPLHVTEKRRMGAVLQHAVLEPGHRGEL